MSIKDFTERRQLRGREMVSSDGYLNVNGERMYVGEQQFTPEELRRAERALERWHRHTVDIAPQPVEDELLAFERGWRYAKVAWGVLFVLVVGYVVWRLAQ